jgi:hypothetical protein
VFAIAATDTQIKLVPDERVTSVEVLHRLPSRPAEDGMVVEVGQVAAGAPRLVLFRLRHEGGGRRLGTMTVTYRTTDGRAGDARILGVELPAVPVGAHIHQVTHERLRLEVATAVDVAWARRASGDSAQALAGLGAVERQVTKARDGQLLAGEAATELIAEIAAARDAVQRSASERERLRRGMRERSQITLLGQSQVGRVPDEEE